MSTRGRSGRLKRGADATNEMFSPGVARMIIALPYFPLTQTWPQAGPRPRCDQAAEWVLLRRCT